MTSENCAADKIGSTRQRLTVFVAGFDPRGVRYYHQLMAQQAKLQGEVDDTAYQVGPRQVLKLAPDTHRHAQWSFGSAGGKHSDYVFFDWSDLVRAQWPGRLMQVLGQAAVTYALVLRRWRVLIPVRQQTPNTLLAFVYPLVYALLAMLLAVGVGWACSGVLASHVPYVHWLLPVAAAGLVLWGATRLDKVLHVSWMLRIFNFARRSASQPMPELDARLQAMADWLTAQIKAQPQLEVVVVGFSVGSVQAVLLVDKVRQQMNTESPLTLLTLGNCLPLFTLMPKEDVLYAALQRLEADPGLYWADISSPGDSVSFGMCDLLELRRRELTPAAELRHNPQRMCSPRFHKLFEPAEYRWLRRNKMRMHFQYLMAAPKRGAYNFFSMLSTPNTVREFVEKYLVR